MAQQSLEELLIKTNAITAAQLADAQRDSEARKHPLAQSLIALGFFADREFAQWISGVTNLPLVDPLRADVIADIEAHVPAEVAREFQIVPIDVEADEMTIATVDPLDKTSLDAIHEATGMKIHPVIGIRSQLAQMVERFYPKQPDFDPSATVSVSIEREPFEFGDETMLRHHSLEFAYASVGEDSLGSETRVLPPEPKVETQLDRIERRIGELVQAIEALQRRIDAIDATLARALNR